MKILHVVFSFPPDPPGGTEIYVSELCRNLDALSVRSVVAAPAARESRYTVAGLDVRRFAVGDPLSLEELYGGDGAACASFARILDDEVPDVVHQHAFTAACSHLLIEECKRRGIPVVLTIHTPTVTCQRGTLLEHGTTPCDGRLAVARCAACTLDAFGSGSASAHVLAHVPTALGEVLGWLERRGGAWTALRMSSLLQRRHDSVVTALQAVDRIVVLTPWVAALLEANGISSDRMVRSAHGLVPRLVVNARARGTEPELRVVHLGRADKTKGTDLLIRAVRQAPQLQIALDIFTVVQSPTGVDLLRDLQRLAGDDERIRFLPALPPDEVVSRLATYDVIAVPSQWMETGPLVVLEAFQAGTPVIGSALGGIADKVRDGVDGLLVTPFNSVDAWSDALRRCATDRDLVGRLAAGVTPPRAASAVAAEMLETYQALGASPSRDAVAYSQAAR